MKFDWGRFIDKKNRIAVHCKTEEATDDFYRNMQQAKIMKSYSF